MNEGISSSFESITQGFLEIAAGIGAIALGFYFFKKAKDSGKKPAVTRSNP